MSKHLIIVLYVISYTLGFSFLILGFFGWLKYRKETIKYLLICAASLTLILIEQMVTAYDTINIVESRSIYIIITFLSAVGCGLMIYALTKLNKLVTRRTLSKKIILLLITASVLPVILTALYLVLKERIIVWTAGSILFGFILYNVLDLLTNMDRIENKVIRTMIRRTIAVSLIMVPILFLDLFIEKIPGIGDYFPYGLLSVFVFYFMLSSMGLFYMIKHYNIFFNQTVKEGIEGITEEQEEITSDGLWKEYNITAREKEIILLLINGKTYNDIGNQLVISLPTVKTHVHHIYRKLAIKNRIELVNIIRNHTKV